MDQNFKYEWTVKVGKRGQFVIPMEARRLFGIQPGDTLIVLADAGKGLAIPCRNLLVKLVAEEEGKA